MFPNLKTFIRSLGTNDEERGKVLGVSGRTIRRWLNEERYPDGWVYLKKNPILKEPFCKDIESDEQVAA